MRILVDECVPRQIKRCLSEHEAKTVQEAGYGGYANGELLLQAEVQFDLFITSDKNLRYQQNLEGRKMAILLLSDNKRDVIIDNFALISAAVDGIRASEFMELDL